MRTEMQDSEVMKGQVNAPRTQQEAPQQQITVGEVLGLIEWHNSRIFELLKMLK